MIGGIFGGLTSDEIETKADPNQGIRRSAWSAIICAMAFALIGWFVFRVYGALFIGLLGGLVYGGYACLSHLALRFVLWQSEAMPWNYARFLDNCADRIFLRKVGGGYIFIHRMLMEYFADLDTTAIEETQKKAT